MDSLGTGIEGDLGLNLKVQIGIEWERSDHMIGFWKYPSLDCFKKGRKKIFTQQNHLLSWNVAQLPVFYLAPPSVGPQLPQGGIWTLSWWTGPWPFYPQSQLPALSSPPAPS